MNIQWYCKDFTSLLPEELYQAMRLRNAVFVVEQNCVFQDADNKDQSSYHFMAWNDEKLVAYARIVPPGIIYEQASIGRVVTSPSVRHNSIGKELMKKSIESIHKLFGVVSIKIGAQLYLQKFYSSFGFQQTSNVYLEDGIEHIEMISSPAIS